MGRRTSFIVRTTTGSWKLCGQGWLRHTGDKTLTRHVLNAIARPATYGDLRFDRPSESRTTGQEKQRRRVIDRLTAAAMVHTSVAVELSVGDTEWVFA